MGFEKLCNRKKLIKLMQTRLVRGKMKSGQKKSAYLATIKECLKTDYTDSYWMGTCTIEIGGEGQKYDGFKRLKRFEYLGWEFGTWKAALEDEAIGRGRRGSRRS